MTDRPFITPQDISTLARPCYADEAKALAYIYEAEQNDIKPKIGDDLYLRLKDGENALLLEGGEYTKNGKRYQLNGIKKALAYYAYSRLLESSSVDLTRQGAVNRRSDSASSADDKDIISISRETYAIADRYMQEIADYLGLNVEQTQRTSVGLIGASNGVSRQRVQQTSVGAIDPNKYATKEYVDGKIAALDFPEVGDFETKSDADEKLAEAKRYTDDAVANIDIPELPTLAKVAESGSYNDLKDKPTIPSVEGLATEAYVDEKVKAVKVPAALSELKDDASHRLVTDSEKQAWSAKSDFDGDYNKLSNKPTIPTSTSQLANNSGFITSADVPKNLSQLAEDATHRVVTDTEKQAWNAKSDFDGNYNSLTNKPTIPSVAGLATEKYVDDKVGGVKVPASLAELSQDATHRVVTDSEKASWNAKSDFSGNYNDLTNKPTIPAAVTESTISGWGYTKNTGTYSKPSGGIPKTDMASDVQQSLSKADTALQAEQYKGTVTGVKINGTTKNPSNGIVDLGNVITSHQDISGKQDKLVSGTNIKTINGQSILGSGNITISGGGGSAGGAYALQEHGSDDTIFTLTPNTFHVWGEVESLELSLGEAQEGVANEYLFQFKSGSEATALTLPADIVWANGDAPTIESKCTYQVSILNGFAAIMKFKKKETVISEFSIGIVEGWGFDNMYSETYEFEVGMTWGEWVNSKYNTNGYYEIYIDEENEYYNGTIFNNNVSTTPSGDNSVLGDGGMPVYSHELINGDINYDIS